MNPNYEPDLHGQYRFCHNPYYDKLLTSVLSAIISAAETGSTALPVDSS